MAIKVFLPPLSLCHPPPSISCLFSFPIPSAFSFSALTLNSSLHSLRTSQSKAYIFPFPLLSSFFSYPPPPSLLQTLPSFSHPPFLFSFPLPFLYPFLSKPPPPPFLPLSLSSLSPHSFPPFFPFSLLPSSDCNNGNYWL